MEVAREDRVKMPSRPEWGLGQVIQDPAAGKVCVLFREVGEKILSLKHAKIVCVEGEEARDVWLDSMNLDPITAGTRYLGPQSAMEAFQAKFPGGFQGTTYLEEERAPKVAAHELAIELLDEPALGSLLDDGAFEKVGAAALRVIGKTNLVFPSDRLALSKALKLPGNPELFARGLRDQLYGDDDPDVRFKRFGDVLSSMKAARWTLVTYFPFIRFPSDYMVVKPSLTQASATLCRFDLAFRPEPNRATYGRVLAFAGTLRETFSELEPVDMFDIQALMWCLAGLKG